MNSLQIIVSLFVAILLVDYLDCARISKRKCGGDNMLWREDKLRSCEVTTGMDFKGICGEGSAHFEQVSKTMD